MSERFEPGPACERCRREGVYLARSYRRGAIVCYRCAGEGYTDAEEIEHRALARRRSIAQAIRSAAARAPGDLERRLRGRALLIETAADDAEGEVLIGEAERLGLREVRR